MKSRALDHLIRQIDKDLREVLYEKEVNKTISSLKKLIKLEVYKNIPSQEVSSSETSTKVTSEL